MLKIAYKFLFLNLFIYFNNKHKTKASYKKINVNIALEKINKERNKHMSTIC